MTSQQCVDLGCPQHHYFHAIIQLQYHLRLSPSHDRVHPSRQQDTMHIRGGIQSMFDEVSYSNVIGPEPSGELFVWLYV